MGYNDSELFIAPLDLFTIGSKKDILPKPILCEDFVKIKYPLWGFPKGTLAVVMDWTRYKSKNKYTLLFLDKNKKGIAQISYIDEEYLTPVKTKLLETRDISDEFRDRFGPYN
jgi:hypothetical protein